MSGISTIGGMTPGEYGSHALSQRKVCDYLYTNCISKALDQILKDGKEKELKIGDFGAADCFNSTDIYKKTLEKVSDKYKIVFSVNDLPVNDWKITRQNCSTVGLPIIEGMNYMNGDGDKYIEGMNGHKDEYAEVINGDGEEYVEKMNGDGDTYIEGMNGHGNGSRIEFVGKSFFGQCLANESMDIAFTSSATHWLSDVSGMSLHGSVSHQAHYERTSKEDRQEIKTRGLKDAVNFLVSRAKELKAGGWLFMGVSVVLEKDEKSILATYKDLYETMNDVFVKWVKQGKITQDQVHQMFNPLYEKTMDEWKACFENPRVKSAGLYMEDSMVVLLENPYYSQVYSSTYLKSEGEGKAAMKFASEYVKSMLAWEKNTLMRVLKTEERLKEYVDDITEVIAAEPTKYRWDYFIQYIVARKQGINNNFICGI